MFSLLSYDTRSQTAEWECLSLPRPNDFIYDLIEYKGNLIIAGGFYKIGTERVNAIVSFDGNKWLPLQNGLRRKNDNYSAQVGQTLVYHDDLYIIGDFDSAGNISAKDIAKWNGNQWSGFGVGTNGNIQCISSYKNEIYVGGSFDSIGGIAANNIAKWNGSQWQPLSKGLVGFGVNCLYEYKSELYALGAIDSAGGIACNAIARWNGIKWDKVSDKIKGGSCMIEWNNILLIGSQKRLENNIVYKQVMQWDGNSCALLCERAMFDITDLEVYNGNLYCAGGHVGLFNSITKQWDFVSQELSSGMDNDVISLGIYNNHLYSSGTFNKGNGSKCDFIAQLTNNTSLVPEVKFYNKIIFYPNPFINDITIYECNKGVEELVIFDLLSNEMIRQKFSGNTTLDLRNLSKGIYYYEINNESGLIERGKIIKE